MQWITKRRVNMENSLRALLLLATLFTGVIAGRIAQRSETLEVDATLPFSNPETPLPDSREPCYSLAEAVDQCSSLLGHDGVLSLCENFSNGTHNDHEEFNINEFIENWKNETLENTRATPTVDLPQTNNPLPSSTSDEDENGEREAMPMMPLSFHFRDQQSKQEDRIKTVTELSRELLQNAEFADYTFIVGKEKTVIKAHSIFLARASPFFQALFREEKQKRVLVPDVTPDAFRVLLDYAYTGEVCLDDFSTACELVGVSASMALSELRQQSLQYLEDELQPGNVWKAIHCASKVNNSQMMNLALKMIETNTEEALSDPAFTKISHDALMTFLNKDSMNVKSELQVLDATLRWAMAEAARRSMTPDPETLRTVLGPALGLIRFLTLTPSEFANMQSTAKLLNYGESLSVIFNLNSPGVTPLPPTISKLNTPRNSYISSAEVSYYNIRGDSSTIAQYSCSKSSVQHSTYKPSEQPDFPLLTTNYNRAVHVKAIQIPSQVCSFLNPRPYKEDLTVEIFRHNGGEVAKSYRYSKVVPCNSLLTIKFPQSAVLNSNTHYRIEITFHVSGKYPKVYSDRTSRNWPVHKHLEGSSEAAYFYEYAGQFLNSIITEGSNDFRS